MVSSVKVIRKQLLLTQDELGERIGVCRQMIAAYEAGRSIPRKEVVKKLMEIAKAHNIFFNAADFFK